MKWLNYISVIAFLALLVFGETALAQDDLTKAPEIKSQTVAKSDSSRTPPARNFIPGTDRYYTTDKPEWFRDRTAIYNAATGRPVLRKHICKQYGWTG